MCGPTGGIAGGFIGYVESESAARVWRVTGAGPARAGRAEHTAAGAETVIGENSGKRWPIPGRRSDSVRAAARLRDTIELSKGYTVVAIPANSGLYEAKKCKDLSAQEKRPTQFLHRQKNIHKYINKIN